MILRLRPLILVSLALAAALRSPAADALWYTQPAAKWTDALPVGNGRLGAMVFGGVESEHIQFNEDTLWTGHPHDYARAGARAYLGPIRELIGEGKVDEAGRLAKENFLGDPPRQKAYQPFGDIRLRFPAAEPVASGTASTASNYRRELDLTTGTVRVSYDLGGVTFQREIFASYPDHVIVAHFAANQPGHVSFTLALTSPHHDSATRRLDATTVALTGQVEQGGLRFEARVRVQAQGGTVTVDDASIHVGGADSATVLLVAATSFKTFQDISGDPAAACAANLAALQGRSFASLQTAQRADYQRLFSSVTFRLPESESAAALPTDERLSRVKAQGLAIDPSLAALYFQYGRYLLIASSRAGGQPANLQGLWNDQMDPPWESKWTTNINLEMNYWPAEVTNLGECTAPLFDLIDDLVVSGSRTAQVQYGAHGWVLHHNTDLWRGTAPINGIDGVWPTGGAWLCQHLWEHYLFSGDREFLRTRAYPVMKQAAQFFVDALIKDPRTGWLVTSPSYSPEQGTLTEGPTMDNQLIRALFEHTAAAAKLLAVDDAFAQQLNAEAAQLPPNQIGRYGQLQEWLADIDKPNNAHRHMSPLWALYPGADITPDDPKVFAAAKLLLTWRGTGSTGWSYAWRIPLWARIGDGEYAFNQLSQLFQRKTLPNLFDLCGPFQIDGNFGTTAGIAEMLLQSHTRTERGDVAGIPQIDLLPALPKAWPAGAISGLRARGGFTVDLTWREGALEHARVHGPAGAACRLRYAGRSRDITLPASGLIEFTAERNADAPITR